MDKQKKFIRAQVDLAIAERLIEVFSTDLVVELAKLRDRAVAASIKAEAELEDEK